jgi:hypothetical protein
MGGFKVGKRLLEGRLSGGIGRLDIERNVEVVVVTGDLVEVDHG